MSGSRIIALKSYSTLILLQAYAVNRDLDGVGRDADYIEYCEHAIGDPGRPEIRTGHRRRVTWEDIRQKIVNTGMMLWDLLLRTSYILAIICMMVSREWSSLHIHESGYSY